MGLSGACRVGGHRSNGGVCPRRYVANPIARRRAWEFCVVLTAIMLASRKRNDGIMHWAPIWSCRGMRTAGTCPGQSDPRRASDDGRVRNGPTYLFAGREWLFNRNKSAFWAR